jgi:hypothetical protein
MRAQEFITERRDRMYQYIRSIVPTWPEYIVKDWLYANQAKPFGRQSNITPADRSFETLRTFIPELLADIGLTVDTKWQLVPNMKFTMDMWEPKTKQRLIARAGGKPTELVPSTMAPNMKDAERHATQAALAKQQGGVRKEPVILIKTPQGYELLEGWHRTIQHFARYPDGYTGPAYVAVSQVRSGVAENMDHSQDGRAVEELKSALLAKRDQLQSVSDDQVYDIIDKIMTRIARSHSISGQKLHDMWVDRYKQIPDTWIMNEQQGVAEDLNEIYKMPPTKDSSQGMTIWAYNDALEKKLPVVHKDKNVTIFKSNEDLLRYIILQDGNPVLYIGFSKFLDGYKSGAVATEIQGRGKGLAQKAYINASDILGVPIYSDSTQTDASRLGIWDKLIQQYPDRIVGYDQKTNKNLPLSVGDKGPIVNQNQPIYVDRNPIDTKKPVSQNQRYRTRILKLLPIKQGVAEGQLTESAIFLNPNTVIVGQQHSQPLELSPETLKKVQAIAAQHGAWYEGNGADRAYTRGVIDRYVGSFDDEVAKTASPNDPKWIYVLFANVDANNRIQRVGVDPKDTIFNRLMDTAQDNSFQGIGFTDSALKKFLSMASEGKYDFVKMSQLPATQENLTRFLKAGEALMWPSNWEQYPNRAGKIARAATVDTRDQYLATRKAGVYVVGAGHLKAVQDISGKQGVEENFADGKGPGRPGDSQRHGIPKKATMAELEKASHAKGRKGQLARWQLNMRRGRKKTNEVTVGVLNLGEFAINVDDHAFERAQQRKINLADIDTVLRKIKLPRVIKKIMDIDVGNRFYVLDHVTDVALGFRRIGDKKLVLKTVYPGRPMDLNIAGIITV